MPSRIASAPLAGSYIAAKASLFNETLDGATGGLRAAGLGELAGNLEFLEDTANFTGFGIEYDTFDWFIGGEWTKTEVEDSYNPTTTSYYVSAGFRSGKWTPALTYESQDANNPFKFLDKVAALPAAFQPTATAVPAAFQPTATAVVVGLQQTFVDEYDVVSLSLRYDLDTNVALKADVSKSSNDVNSAEDANLLRFAVNYVF
jgi:hypothetical protein